MRPYQRFSLVEIFKSFENVPKLYFSLQQKISTFKPEDDIINIETGRNDNKKTLIIIKVVEHHFLTPIRKNLRRYLRNYSPADLVFQARLGQYFSMT